MIKIAPFQQNGLLSDDFRSKNRGPNKLRDVNDVNENGCETH